MNISKDLRVKPESLRRLAKKLSPSVINGALTESADYIEALEKKIEEHQKVLEKVMEFTFEKEAWEVHEHVLKCTKIIDIEEKLPFYMDKDGNLCRRR